MNMYNYKTLFWGLFLYGQRPTVSILLGRRRYRSVCRPVACGEYKYTKKKGRFTLVALGPMPTSRVVVVVVAPGVPSSAVRKFTRGLRDQ